MPFRYLSKHQCHFPREVIIKVLQCWTNEDKICSLLIFWFARVAKPKFICFMNMWKFNVYANPWNLQDYSNIAHGDRWTGLPCVWADFAMRRLCHPGQWVCAGGSFSLQALGLSSPIKSSWNNSQNLCLLFRNESEEDLCWGKIWSSLIFDVFILIGDVHTLKFRLSVNLVCLIFELFSSC